MQQQVLHHHVEEETCLESGREAASAKISYGRRKERTNWKELMHNRMREEQGLIASCCGSGGRRLQGRWNIYPFAGRRAQDNCLVKSVDTGSGAEGRDSDSRYQQQFTCMFRKEGDFDVTLSDCRLLLLVSSISGQGRRGRRRSTRTGCRSFARRRIDALLLLPPITEPHAYHFLFHAQGVGQ